MSDEYLPSLPGLSWSVFKKPKFNTAVQTSASQSELRASFSATPIYEYSLTYDVIRDTAAHDELRTMAGFFMARRGRFDSFLFNDSSDNAATDQLFGVGDGLEVEFQLVRSYGGFTEKVANGLTITQVTVDNSPTTAYTVSPTGLVTMNSAAGAGQLLRWSGTYAYRCRFKADLAEFENFMRNLWSNKAVEFLANLGTKL